MSRITRHPKKLLLQSGKIVVPTIDGQIAAGAIPRLVQSLPIVTADAAGFPQKLIRGDHDNFAPRLGFAYRLGEKTVVRGGYGIYFGSVFGAQVLAAPKNPPFVLTELVESASPKSLRKHNGITEDLPNCWRDGLLPTAIRLPPLGISSLARMV